MTGEEEKVEEVEGSRDEEKQMDIKGDNRKKI